MIELPFKFVKNTPENRIQLKESWDAFNGFLSNWDRTDILSRKEVRAFLLDKDDFIIGEVIIYSGTLSRKHLNFIKSIAVKENVKSIIVAENNLEADVIPSLKEKEHFKEISKIGDKMDMFIKDQMILARNGYYSYKDNVLEY
jgi:DNA repair protein RadC